MRYETPNTIQAAVQLLQAEQGLAKVLSGGTDLLVQLKSGMVEPDLVVDLKSVAATHEMREDDAGFHIGATVPSASLREHKAFRAAWPAIIEGAKLIGSTQVQGRATLTGNLCNASPAADSVPGMVVAGAVANVAGPDGVRQVPVQDIPERPGRTSLKKGELIESFYVPKPGLRTGSSYFRFTPRTEMDIAVVSAAVAISLDEKGICTDARVALGAVAIKIVVAEEAAKALIGTNCDAAAMEKLQKAASAAAAPIDDKRGTKEFRVDVVGVLARRAAEKALARAKGEEA